MDWDHTAWDNPNDAPADGFRDFLDEIHSRGNKIIVHSCNQPSWIRKMCDEYDLRVDAIWGESPMDHGAKPVAALYVDDRGYHFDGDWTKATGEILELVDERPVHR